MICLVFTALLELTSPMVLEIPGLFSSPFYIDIDYP